MKNKLLLIVGFFSIFLQACDKCNIDYDFVYNNGLNFRLLSKTNKQPLLGLAGSYNFNDVKIFNENGKSIDVETDGSATIYFLTYEDRKISSGTQIRRQFYLYLSPTDTDTITVDFVKSVDDCGYDNLSNVEFRYNDILYTNVSCCHNIDFYK
ncbi:hypothetical protein Q0590_19930 [Rhodocytophaga aerolata]|uniref:Uncharacterized protein n=1 Tax=Rhodocytophaga aerolata TaxID=455078 RepID=A0ABT8RCU2_9BACT|nr:hypothetical protein [Rhodocytophaga aerolata]MDO1448557.1 hypothetical protein [Rhodocytophaga aerolata]